MGGVVSQSMYSLDDVRSIAGSRWTQEYYTKFMSVAVLKPIVRGDGTVEQQYRVGADFVNREIAVHMAEQDLKDWTKKNAIATHNYAGHSMCLFSSEEIAACTDTSCESKDAEVIKTEFCTSPVAQHLRDYLGSLPFYANDGELLDPEVYLFAVDPVARCNEICKEHGSLFFDTDYAAGPQLAGPFSGTHESKPPYNFANLRCFLRFLNANPPPTCVFDESSTHSVIDTVVQVDTMCGNSEILAAIGSVAGLYNGDYIKTLLNPSGSLSPYGLYSLKVRIMADNPMNGGLREMVDAYVLVDDFIPCDESGCMIFASSHKYHSQSAWACILEKAVTKLFGQSRGGYREIAHSPEYAGRLMEVLTGVTCKQYDVGKIKDWNRLHKLLQKGHDCRIGAATVTKKDLRKSKAQGIVTGVGVHGYTLLKTIEIKTKFKNPHRLLRLRNTWGRYEWKGAWSDESPQFKEHEKILATPGGDDGSFWINVEDFISLFQGIYAVIIPTDWSSHTKRTLFLHTKAELRNSFYSTVSTKKPNRSFAKDDTSPIIDTGSDISPLYSELMNSEHSRSIKGPEGLQTASADIVPLTSLKMSSKFLSSRVAGKISQKISTKTPSCKAETVEAIGSDQMDDYGGSGRRLPRRRRSTFIF